MQYISTKKLFYFGFVLFFWTAKPLYSQKTYLVHSHNDYHQNIPFWYAYSNGASSIEVDLFLRKDTLFVTHGETEIQPSKTFESLYLDPLEKIVSSGEFKNLQVLIDVKSEAYATLEEVIESIQARPLLTENKSLKFVISGNRPRIEDYPNYPKYILFDHQSVDDLDRVDLAKVAMISKSFKDYSVWNGYGRMTHSDLKAVSDVISKAQMSDKPFRFWATPDTKTAWNAFASLGVDYINTDKPGLARRFLDNLDKNIYKESEVIETYNPKNDFDETKRPKNVILMIGDGNGLAQISATMIANLGNLSLTNIKNVALINTSSADDLITDSAAGGTAMATGVKSNNRAIGVDPSGTARPTLIEILSRKGYNTGIISTDAIYGATPSTFYAHTPERDDTDKIIADLLKSEVDFFISGGKAKEKLLSESFASKTLEEFSNLDEQTAIYMGESKMPSIQDGRGSLFYASVEKALEVLNEDEKPFFLMIEGAQIDNGGHANDISVIVSEMLDFDKAVRASLKFVDAYENTLLVITADHETGGLGVAGGDLHGTVRADFLSVDHSGILVPLFAYGPQSDNFRGVYNNTEVFEKILEALELEVSE